MYYTQRGMWYLCIKVLVSSKGYIHTSTRVRYPVLGCGNRCQFMSQSGETGPDDGGTDQQVSKMCCPSPSLAQWADRMCAIWRADQKGWIVCMCIATIGLIGTGVMFSFGIFIVALKDQYHTSLMEQNFIASTPICMAMLPAPLAVMLIRRMGRHGYRAGCIMGIILKTASCVASSFVHNPHWLFLTYSFTMGFGNCMVFMVSALIVAEYFDRGHKYHVFATSIVRYPVPLGVLIFSPITASMIARYGWRVTLRVYAVPLLVVGVLLSLPFTPKHPEPEFVPLTDTPSEQVQGEVANDVTSHEREGSCHLWKFREMCQKPVDIFWYFGNFVTALGYTVPLFNLPYYMSLRGIAPTDSAWILTMMGITEFCTYVVFSLLGDRFKGRLVYVNVAAAAMMTLWYSFLPLIDVSYGPIALFMILIAFCNGLLNIYQYPAAIEVTGLRMDLAWAGTNFWAGPGMVIGPPFFGLIYDTTRNFDYVFYVTGSCYCLQLVSFMAIVLLRKKQYGQRNSVDYQQVS